MQGLCFIFWFLQVKLTLMTLLTSTPSSLTKFWLCTQLSVLLMPSELTCVSSSCNNMILFVEFTQLCLIPGPDVNLKLQELIFYAFCKKLSKNLDELSAFTVSSFHEGLQYADTGRERQDILYMVLSTLHALNMVLSLFTFLSSTIG